MELMRPLKHIKKWIIAFDIKRQICATPASRNHVSFWQTVWHLSVFYDRLKLCDSILSNIVLQSKAKCESYAGTGMSSDQPPLPWTERHPKNIHASSKACHSFIKYSQFKWERRYIIIRIRIAQYIRCVVAKLFNFSQIKFKFYSFIHMLRETRCCICSICEWMDVHANNGHM